MKKQVCFTGVGTALVTPLLGGEIDYLSLQRLIEYQISGGVDALIVGGTTGEAATLSDAEREKLYSFCAEKIGGRVKFIVGTGSLDTKKAREYTRLAKRVGADAALAVTPYYNKGTEQGLIYHFLAIAEETEIPTIIYNVPTRTCVNVSVSALQKLSEHENIAGLKESSDSIARLSELSELGDSLPLYSGNDYANLLFYSVGALGAISVVSNLYPVECKRVFSLYKSGKRAEALKKQNDMGSLVRALFKQTNPSVVKFALSRFGLCSSELRLPLTEPCSAVREELVCAIEMYEKTLHV